MSLGNKPRVATAVCAELTKVLIVHAADFPRFLQVVPSFSPIIAASAKSYSVLNDMADQEERERMLNSIDADMDPANSGGGDSTGRLSQTAPPPASLGVGRKDRLIESLVAASSTLGKQPVMA